MRQWRVGDVVRVVKHDEPRAIGIVFTVESFSTMYFMGHCPTLLNPFRSEAGQPTFLRFEPEQLVVHTLLDDLATAVERVSGLPSV